MLKLLFSIIDEENIIKKHKQVAYLSDNIDIYRSLTKKLK